MEKKIVIGAAAAFALIAGFALMNGSSAEPATAPAGSTEQADAAPAAEPVVDGTYVISTESTVSWEGRKPRIAGYKDVGTLAISEGTVTFEGGVATAGRFVFDMTALKVGKTGRNAGEPMLERHLKSDDFFAVETHPTAEFVLTGAEGTGAAGEYVVRGDLTIKGITNPIEFPATIVMEDGAVRARAALELDRTLWDIRYASEKFFADLADKMIDDKFGVSFDLVGRAE